MRFFGPGYEYTSSHFERWWHSDTCQVLAGLIPRIPHLRWSSRRSNQKEIQRHKIFRKPSSTWMLGLWRTAKELAPGGIETKRNRWELPTGTGRSATITLLDVAGLWEWKGWPGSCSTVFLLKESTHVWRICFLDISILDFCKVRNWSFHLPDFFLNMAPGQWSAQAAWLWLFHWAKFGSLSDVCHIRPDHWLQKLHRSSHLEFPLLQQIHMGGDRVFTHNWFIHRMGISSTCQFCRLSIWLFILFIFCPVSGGGGVIPIIPSIRQCVFLIFDSPGFGDVLMVSYVVSICAFVPFLLPISFQGLLSKLSMEIQGLNSRPRHPWTVLGPEI